MTRVVTSTPAAMTRSGPPTGSCCRQYCRTNPITYMYHNIVYRETCG